MRWLVRSPCLKKHLPMFLEPLLNLIHLILTVQEIKIVHILHIAVTKILFVLWIRRKTNCKFIMEENILGNIFKKKF